MNRKGILLKETMHICIYMYINATPPPPKPTYIYIYMAVFVGVIEPASVGPLPKTKPTARFFRGFVVRSERPFASLASRLEAHVDVGAVDGGGPPQREAPVRDPQLPTSPRRHKAPARAHFGTGTRCAEPSCFSSRAKQRPKKRRGCQDLNGLKDLNICFEAEWQKSVSCVRAYCSYFWADSELSLSEYLLVLSRE